MSRYIFIESHTGYVWGDTADLGPPPQDETPLEAAMRLDNHIGRPCECEYDDLGPSVCIPPDKSGYYIFSADSDAIPVHYHEGPEIHGLLEEHGDLVAAVVVTQKEED